MRYSKLVVAACIAATLAYTAAVLFLCLASGQVPPDSLTAAFFAMYGLELGACAAIKVSDNQKEKRGEHERDVEETDEP